MIEIRADSIELRGFALTGMLECWNNGIMGSGKMG
jgi:hypothetical protein